MSGSYPACNRGLFFSGMLMAVFAGCATDTSSPPITAWRSHRIDEGYLCRTAVMGDVNGDGILDAMASDQDTHRILLLTGPAEIDEEILTPHSLAAGDIDGDVDAVAVGIDSMLVAWYENNGRGSFKRHTIAPDQKSNDVRLLDADRDGVLDVLVAGQLRKNVIWFENLGAKK